MDDGSSSSSPYLGFQPPHPRNDGHPSRCDGGNAEQEVDMRFKLIKAIQLITIIAIGIVLAASVVVFARISSGGLASSGPIPPPVGYPKLSESRIIAPPALPFTNGVVLEYNLV